MVCTKETLHRSRAGEQSPFAISAGIREREENADDHLQLEVHGPDGGLQDAELGAGEGVGGGDVGDERFWVRFGVSICCCFG